MIIPLAILLSLFLPSDSNCEETPGETPTDNSNASTSSNIDSNNIVDLR